MERLVQLFFLYVLLLYKELKIYKQYPDTFFGKVKEVQKNTDNPVDLYYFFFDTYKKSSKENLIKWMKDFISIDILQGKSQKELAEMYCEGLVYNKINKKNKK